MKWLVWLLILLNVALFGYFQLSEMQAAGARQGHEPIQAEQIKLLAKEQLAALVESAPVKPPEDTAVPMPETPACYEWGSFPATSVPRVRNVLQQLGLEFSVRQTEEKQAVRYWVYIPPLASLQEAQARSDALLALGVAETFVVQEVRWRNAISLGIFSDKASADRLTQELRNRGVLDVVSGIRNQERDQSSFLIKNLAPGRVEEISRLRPDFPYAELSPAACQ